MSTPVSPQAPASPVIHTIVRTPKFLLIIVLISVATNIYLFNKTWNDGKPVMHSPVSDEHIVMTTRGGLLEVTTIKATEQFNATHEHLFWGMPLGDTLTQIRVPAVYRYHIELAPNWRILLRDKTFIVVAPPVMPSLPVAIDTSRLEARSFGVWSVFTGQSELNQLQRSITQSLATKAASPVYIQLQREIARKTTAEFVAKWLISQERWKSASAYPIRVFFADEPIQALGNTPPPLVGT